MSDVDIAWTTHLSPKKLEYSSANWPIEDMQLLPTLKIFNSGCSFHQNIAHSISLTNYF